MSAVFHAKFAENGRHMRFYGGFRHIQFISNLLVEQTIRQHAKYLVLLRSQRGDFFR
ncbi:Uncharacterised protein [Vibrio cholerae]|uniref:Uncharacterized protein n=1 Tax=Vibrio cholerae TaxID=666 RepID=A0A655VYZ1_VIBCL|nr:Uncharacterised protein [Vibrio cholerae]